MNLMGGWFFFFDTIQDKPCVAHGDVNTMQCVDETAKSSVTAPFPAM